MKHLYLVIPLILLLGCKKSNPVEQTNAQKPTTGYSITVTCIRDTVTKLNGRAYIWLVKNNASIPITNIYILWNATPMIGWKVGTLNLVVFLQQYLMLA